MARTRRQYGTGSVYRRADGRWIGAIQDGWTARGTRHVRQVSAATEAECKRRMARLRRAIDAGEAAAGHVTVKAWGDQWLSRTEHEVRPSTWTGYRTAVRVWIVPTIGHRRLDALTPGDVRAVSDALRAAGRSTTTARLTHAALRLLLAAAVQDGHQVAPRVLGVQPPARAVNDRADIPLPDLLAILTVARGRADYGRWLAAALYGLRQGEALGMTWECVDLAAGTLAISWQLDALPYAAPGRRAGPLRIPDGYEHRVLHGAQCLVRPKSAHGQRMVPIIPAMAEALADAPRVHDLVWPALRADRRGAARWLPQTDHGDADAWHGLQDAAGIRHRTGRYYGTHEIRHTAATLLLALGVDESVRLAMLGHSSITTTRAYEHTDISGLRSAAELVAARLLPAAGADGVGVIDAAPDPLGQG